MSEVRTVRFPESGDVRQWLGIGVFVGAVLGAGGGFGLYALAISFDWIERIDGLPPALIAGGGVLGAGLGYVTYTVVSALLREPLEVTPPRGGEVRLGDETYSVEPRPALRVERQIEETPSAGSPDIVYYDVQWLPNGEDDGEGRWIVRNVGTDKHARLREAAETLCRTTGADLVWSHYRSIERRSADELDRSLRERYDDASSDETEASSRADVAAGPWFRMADATESDGLALPDWPTEALEEIEGQCTVECPSDGRLVVDYHPSVDWNWPKLLYGMALSALLGGCVGAVSLGGEPPVFPYEDYAFAIAAGMLVGAGLAVGVPLFVSAGVSLLFEPFVWEIERVEIDDETVTRRRTRCFGLCEQSTTIDLEEIEELHYCIAIGDGLYEPLAPDSLQPLATPDTLEEAFDEPDEHPVQRVLTIGIARGGAPEARR